MKNYFVGICIVLLLSSCGSSTKVIGAWTNDDRPTDKMYNKVFITALTPNRGVRNALEDNFAKAARDREIEAITSGEAFTISFSEDSQPSKEEILSQVKAENADAIFTVTLLDKDSETRYIPGTTYYPMNYGGYYGGFYSYYNTMYPMTYEPGYYTTDKVFYIESNLYDADTEELLWSAQSKTVNPTDIQKFADEYTHIIVDELIKDGVLKKR